MICSQYQEVLKKTQILKSKQNIQQNVNHKNSSPVKVTARVRVGDVRLAGRRATPRSVSLIRRLPTSDISPDVLKH